MSKPKAVAYYWPDIGQTNADAKPTGDLSGLPETYLPGVATHICEHTYADDSDLWDGEERAITIVCDDGSEHTFTVERDVTVDYHAYPTRAS